MFKNIITIENLITKIKLGDIYVLEIFNNKVELSFKNWDIYYQIKNNKDELLVCGFEFLNEEKNIIIICLKHILKHYKNILGDVYYLIENEIQNQNLIDDKQ